MSFIFSSIEPKTISIPDRNIIFLEGTFKKMGLYFQTWNSTCFPALFSQLYIYLLIRLFFCLFLLLKIDTFRTSPAQEQAMPAKRTGRLLLMACLRKSSTLLNSQRPNPLPPLPPSITCLHCCAPIPNSGRYALLRCRLC